MSRSRLVMVVLVLVGSAAGCSSGDDPSAASDARVATTTPRADDSSSTTGVASTTTAPALATSAVEAVPSSSTPVEVGFDLSTTHLAAPAAGGGVAATSAVESRPFDGAELPAIDAGYVETEFLVSGIASTYSGPATGPATVASTGVSYVTRVLVRAPSDPARFSGRVWMEPFNTSGGSDADVIWASVGTMLEDEGDAWVGVTVRASSVSPLQQYDPIRYADLMIPSNDVEWDIIRHLGGLLREGADAGPLAGASVDHLYLAGYSQSGVDVATFASAFNDLTRLSDGSAVFAGYLPAAHTASMTPLQPGDSTLPSFEFTAIGPVDVPVVDIETQSDVEGFIAEITPDFSYTNPGGASARREDGTAAGDLYRLYELPGAPHVADIEVCDGDGSSYPTDFFLRGAVALLSGWAEDGVVPPTAARLELATDDVVSVAALDVSGNTLGGVRSPFVDVPLVRYEAHSTPGAICALSGNQTALTESQLVDRYGSVDGYLAQFTVSLDSTIDAGFLRRADRSALLELARSMADAAFTGDG